MDTSPVQEEQEVDLNLAEIPASSAADVDLDKVKVEIESDKERESSQTGSSEVTLDPPSLEEETGSPTMGDEEIPRSKSPSDDVNPAEIDTSRWWDTDPSSVAVVLESVAGGDEEEEEEESYNIPEAELSSFLEEPLTSKSTFIPEEASTSKLIDVNSEEPGSIRYIKAPIVISDRDESTEEEDDESVPQRFGGSDGNLNKDEECEGAVGGAVGPKFPRPTKVVLRMLPPSLSNEEFIESVSPLPPYDYVQVDNPDPEWGIAKSVAHINFLDPDDALWFVERFTGYEFFDSEGLSYISLGDFAMSQKVFRPPPNKSVTNPDRGKLLENEDWLELLNKYEMDPFAFTTGLPLNAVPTAEEMLVEIENRPKRKGPESTPLTEYILNKKSKRDIERQLRREKERERRVLDKLRREKDREADREHREHKKERKRDRRDRERKERRDRERQEKQEKEAKAKGMTVTYSKSGKVTRWSANSGPSTRKEVSENEPLVIENRSKGSTGKSSTPDNKSSGKQGTDSKQPTKSDNSGFGRKQPRLNNPFSKDAKKHDRPHDEKPKFGKPFPLKSEKSSESEASGSKSVPEKDKDKPENKSTAERNARPTGDGDSKPKKETIPPSKNNNKPSGSTEAVDKQGPAQSQSKKKIVKKIIRVRKVKSREGIEGGAASNGPTSAGDSKPSNTKTVEPKRDDGNTVTKTEAATPKDKESSASKSGPTAAVASSTTDPNKDEKRRRARPDQQIYRPGSLRTSAKEKDSGNVKDGNGRPPQRSRGYGGGGNSSKPAGNTTKSEAATGSSDATSNSDKK